MKNKQPPPNNKPKHLISQERVNRVLKSIAQLFQPFKDVLTNVIPSSKGIVKVLDFFGRIISRFILFIANAIPLVIGFLKSKLFKIIVLFVILLVVFNTIASRVMNNTTYKTMLAKAISDATGYNTIIEGRVTVNFLLLSLTINNAAFYSPVNKDSNISLNLLSVNHLKIKFSYLSLFVGNLKAKKVEVNRAEVRYKVAQNQFDNSKFISQLEYINSATNLRLVLPEEKIANLKGNENINFIDNLSNLNPNSQIISKEKENLFNEDKLPYDNLKKYINLKDVFAPKEQEREHVVVNIDDKNSIYRILLSLTNKLKFSLAALNYLEFINVTFKLVDSNSKPIIIIDNLKGILGKNLKGNHTLNGEGRIFNKDIFFDFNSVSVNKKDNKFNLIVSYENNNFKTKDFVVNGAIDSSNNVTGEINFSSIALKNIITQLMPYTNFLSSEESSLMGTFTYNNSVLSFPDLKLIINKVANNASFIYNFGGEGVVEVNLNLIMPSLDPILSEFVTYKNNKHTSAFSSLNDILLEWQSNKSSLLTPKFFAFNIQVNDTSINNVPVSKVVLEAFLDNGDNIYINKFQFQREDSSLDLLGRLQLVNKNGVLIMSSSGSISSLCSYNKSSDNLKSFLNSVAGNNDNYSLNAKIFLNDDRLVFNDISGRFGNKIITETNATLMERNNTTDLIISSNLDSLNFLDLKNVYGFNKGSGRLYYDTNHNITGLPDNFTVHLYLYSSQLLFDELNFKNFQMESSIISSGVLIHNFSFSDALGMGSISGSFNFNDKVSPAIIGNIDFSNVLMNTEKLNNLIFSNYKLAGKVVVNGSINLYGDYYYNGINKVNGKLSLLKYERLKINKDNKSPGFYLTLMKLPYEGTDYYQIADLYGNITIYNNLVDLSPNVIRYIENKTDFRGSLEGHFDILKDDIDLKGILNGENTSRKIMFNLKGSIIDAKVSN